MSTKTETARALARIATDTARVVPERRAALAELLDLKKASKTSMAKLLDDEVLTRRVEEVASYDGSQWEDLANLGDSTLETPHDEEEQPEPTAADLEAIARLGDSCPGESVDFEPNPELAFEALLEAEDFEMTQDELDAQTVRSEAKAETEQDEASEGPERPVPAPHGASGKTAKELRGLIGQMSVDLLTKTDLPYAAIAERVRAAYPHAKTTARSLASVAADLRRDGVKVPDRRAKKAQ